MGGTVLNGRGGGRRLPAHRSGSRRGCRGREAMRVSSHGMMWGGVGDVREHHAVVVVVVMVVDARGVVVRAHHGRLCRGRDRRSLDPASLEDHGGGELEISYLAMRTTVTVLRSKKPFLLLLFRFRSIRLFTNFGVVALPLQLWARTGLNLLPDT